jgi:hypothetical protein
LRLDVAAKVLIVAICSITNFMFLLTTKGRSSRPFVLS